MANRGAESGDEKDAIGVARKCQEVENRQQDTMLEKQPQVQLHGSHECSIKGFRLHLCT